MPNLGFWPLCSPLHERRIFILMHASYHPDLSKSRSSGNSKLALIHSSSFNAKASTQPCAHMRTGVTSGARGQPIPKQISGLLSHYPISRAPWPGISFDVLIVFLLGALLGPTFLPDAHWNPRWFPSVIYIFLILLFGCIRSYLWHAGSSLWHTGLSSCGAWAQ